MQTQGDIVVTAGLVGCDQCKSSVLQQYIFLMVVKLCMIPILHQKSQKKPWLVLLEKVSYNNLIVIMNLLSDLHLLQPPAGQDFWKYQEIKV